MLRFKPDKAFSNLEKVQISAARSIVSWECYGNARIVLNNTIDFIGINRESEMKALSVKAFENLRLKIAKSFVQQGT